MIFYRIMHYFGKIFMYPFVRLIYPLKVIGKQNFPKNRSLILVCNHLSIVDVLQVWNRTPGWRRFMAKDELGKGIFRVIIKATGTIFVNRDGTDLKAIKKCIDVLKKGQGLNIFPEGTRNKQSEEIQPLQKGVAMFAIKTGATIVPLNILHKSKPFTKNYLAIGQPFDLNQFDKVANKQNLEKGNQIIYDNMCKVRTDLKKYVDSQ